MMSSEVGMLSTEISSGSGSRTGLPKVVRKLDCARNQGGRVLLEELLRVRRYLI